MKLSCGKSDLTNYKEIGAGFVFEDDLNIKLSVCANEKYEKLCKSKAFEGKLLQLAQLPENGKTVYIIGLGKRSEFHTEFLRRGSLTAYKTAASVRAEKLEIILPHTDAEDSEMAQALAEGAILASYKFDRYKTEKEPEMNIWVCINGKNEAKISEGIKIGKIMGDAQNYVRQLNENPGNIINPKTFCKEAKIIASEHGLKIEILGKQELEKRGMNGILAVGKGSINEPMLITVEYNAGKNLPLYAIVGKGITFDAGGISLKPAKRMHEMKYDKSGACIVLGVLKTVAQLKFPLRILGVIPLAENLPSGTASRPGDVIKTYSGKTVEILNTDAEGRIILGDALAYASEKKPEAIIDVATLTYAIMVALGRCAIGLFSNNEELAGKIKLAGNKTFEKVWELPLWKEYSEMIKGDIADIKNIGGEDGEAGAITAAVFLKEFVGETRWVHLDIAAVDWVIGKHPLIEKGATGTGVRLIVQSLIELVEKK